MQHRHPSYIRDLLTTNRSFYEEYNEDDVPAASSSTQGRSTETAKYVKKQEKERRHREKLREGGRSGRSKHKSNTKKKIDETLKPFYNSNGHGKFFSGIPVAFYSLVFSCAFHIPTQHSIATFFLCNSSQSSTDTRPLLTLTWKHLSSH
ncbi:uncharacterized protein CLUP02_09178 [Colletotrichum lupini]|uniref:Uncharacterized protein n=1 Tax=Colletotrichum lupini TaxID=145971 RepID=A0A9Q8SU84_9PEZI|nr:uncharacterized protein CLUP02_09178 [Colletotrichum lupini]UQC83682.1 hypothetical protein CLUP02_09178 [Colletotrichum lupini]